MGLESEPFPVGAHYNGSNVVYAIGTNLPAQPRLDTSRSWNAVSTSSCLKYRRVIYIRYVLLFIPL